MSKFIVIAGMWCLTDGWFSLSLYWNGVREGKPQTFWRDHYIRVIRMVIGVGLIWVA